MLTLNEQSVPLRRDRIAFGVAFVVLATRLLTLPRTPWELDEFLFMQSVLDFEPLQHHPHPPGYPLVAFLGKIAFVLFRDPFASLVAVSVIGSVIGSIALYDAFARVTQSRSIAAAAVLLFHLSPAMLVHAPLALSDGPALMFMSLAFAVAVRLWHSREGLTAAILLGLFLSASIGSRPQYAIPLLPLLALMFVRIGPWRQRFALVGSFTAVSVGWMIPLVVETGGVIELYRWEVHQATYVAAHDAVISRSGYTTADIALRFIAHPWGQKFSSLPLIAFALAGLAAILWKRQWPAIPIAVVGGIHLAFCLWSTDPADGVRYVLPTLIAVALFAAAGLDLLLGRFRILSAAVGFALCATFVVYVWPILVARTTGPSPPVAAAEFVRSSLPADAVILFDTSMKAHAEYLLRDRRTMPIDQGLREFGDDHSTTLALLVNGPTRDPDGRSFSWPESDAYGKITRNHYRTVSVIDIPVEERYRVVRGVYGLERDSTGDEWRWLAKDAMVVLPDLPVDTIRLRLGLAAVSPYERAEAVISVDGAPVAKSMVIRGRPVDVVVPDSPGETTIRIRSSRSFVPAGVPGTLNRDPRQLSLQMLAIEQK